MKEFYKDAFDGILNQYLLKVRGRERLEHKFSVLLVVAGVLSVAIISLYLSMKTELWIIPLFLLGIVYLISILHIFPRSNIGPWVSRQSFEDLEKSSDKKIEQIYQQLIFEMYYLTGQADKTRKRDVFYLIFCIFLILLSSFSILIIYLFPYDTSVVTLCLSIFFCCLSIVFWGIASTMLVYFIGNNTAKQIE